MVCFGQVVLGPPGAGKTTYCDGIQQMCNALERPVAVINLDPANDELPYKCSIDIKHLLSIEECMQQYQLGPNGALIFCFEYVLKNINWLTSKLKSYQDTYLLIDLPGQVELYTHHSALHQILQIIEKECQARFTVVHLIDSILCTDASKYISALLLSLSGQLFLEMPHINCLTKIDLLKEYKSDLVFQFEYYASARDLHHLLEYIENSSIDSQSKHPLSKKYKKFQSLICEIIEEFNVIGFLPINIQEKESVLNVLHHIDTANGFVFSGISAEDHAHLFKIAISSPTGFQGDIFGKIQEEYIDTDSD